MPRDRAARENHRRLRALRGDALRRIELEYPTEPREQASGVTSMPIKKRPPNLDEMIADFEARRNR